MLLYLKRIKVATCMWDMYSDLFEKLLVIYKELLFICCQRMDHPFALVYSLSKLVRRSFWFLFAPDELIIQIYIGFLQQARAFLLYLLSNLISLARRVSDSCYWLTESFEYQVVFIVRR